MFSDISLPVLPAFAGSDAYYEQQQLQTANRAPCRHPRYHPYTRTSSHTNGAGCLGTSYLGFQFPYFQDISLEHYYKESANLVRGFPKIEKIRYSTTGSAGEEYNYPTLSFLLPDNKMSAFTCSSSIGTSRPTSDFSRNVMTTKKKEQNELHPFYKRQMLSMATPRDGLTRTRDKYRVVYTEKQRKLLEEEYQNTSFISESRRAEIAKTTDLSERQIKFWFQNRRAKDKRNKKTKENLPILSKDKEIGSFETWSPSTAMNSSPCQDNAKHTENTSCRYLTEQLRQDNVSDQQDFNLITEYKTSTLNQLSVSEAMDKPATPPSGTCRYENQNTLVKTGSRTPTGCQVQKHYPVSPSLWTPATITPGSCRHENLNTIVQTSTRTPTGCQVQKQYPVSPSEWTLANQRSYLFDRVDMSPLFNGVQPNFDFRN